MKYETARFGQIEVKYNDILTIPEGLIGFPEYTKFVLIDKEEELPFRTLQSLDDPSFSFFVLTPYFTWPDYRVDITQDELKFIEADTTENVDVYVIVEFHTEISDTTVNLKAPILINIQNNQGHQYILSNTKYGLKEKLQNEG